MKTTAILLPRNQRRPAIHLLSLRNGTNHGAGRRFSHRTFHWPLSGKPGAFRFGDESHPAAIMAVA
jgi:hypothetical protein